MVAQVAIDAVRHYLSKGTITKDVAVGIVAVLYAGESKLDPGPQGTQATETGGVLNPKGAYGIASWNGPRQQKLADFALIKGATLPDLNTELDFVLTEAANSYSQFWAAIQSQTVLYPDVIKVMVETYEIPKDPASEISRALAFAKDLYVVDFPVPTPVPVPTPTPTPGGNQEIAFLIALLQLMQQFNIVVKG